MFDHAAALLTDANCRRRLLNFDSGYPGYRGKIAREAGTLAEMLSPRLSEYMVGNGGRR